MRRASCFTIALILAIAGSFVAATTVSASSSEESQFLSKINAERSSRGLPTLGWSESLANVARNHSQEMASQNDLHHNQNLRNEVSGWDVLGENVGYGPGVDDLHHAFMNSPDHRANVLDTDYTLVGIGTVWKDGTLWVTEDFERPATARASQSSSSSSSGARSRSRNRRSRTQAAHGPASTPPRRPATAPPPPAPVPAGDPSDEAALTRLMVANLLGRDDPAVGTMGVAEVIVAGAPPADMLSVAFGPFGRMVRRVNAALLGGLR